MPYGLNVLSNIGFVLAGAWALFTAGAIVVWWRLTDDLRAYALAQFAPLALIPLMLALFPGRRPTGPLLVGLALYAAGKAAEVADGAIFALGHIVSGHTSKHLLAAAAAGFIARWLAR